MPIDTQRARELCPDGLRRVDWVRFNVSSTEVTAEALGVGFRLPASHPVSLARAAQLVAAGVPHVTRHLAEKRSEA